MIAVYHGELLAWSETFILAQGEAVRGWPVHYVGTRLVPDGLPMPPERTHIAYQGGLVRWRMRLFHHTGRSPSLQRLLGSLRPELVHAHSAFDGVHVLPLCRRLGLPLIVTCHGSDVRRRHLRPYTWPLLFRRRHLWRNAQILCVSDDLRRRLIADGCPPEAVRTHYIGIDTEFFKPPAAAGPPPPRIVFVGRLMQIKGCRELILAAAAISPRVPGMELVVIGTGPEEPALRRLAGSLLGDRCRFLGRLDRDGVRTQLAQARVMCGPSQPGPDGTAEALGMTFLEAQAMGVPVVATRLGGIPEAVEDGVGGLLCDPGDGRGLAEALVRALTDDGAWASWSAAGRRRMEACFDLRRQTAALEGIYREVIAGRRLPADHH